MNKKIRTVAFLAIMCMVGTSCQKEEFIISKEGIIANAAIQQVCYTVDGELHSLNVGGEEVMIAMWERMAALAKEGHEVFLWNGNMTQSCTKEVVTFTTADKEEAIAWCDAMFDAGYKVGMTYDENNHVYVCIATK